MENIKDIYNEIIMEHFQHPFNKKELDKYTVVEESQNPLCGDQLKIFILLQDNIIKDISFTGQGCSISMASASILTSTVINLELTQTIKITEKTIEYIKTGKIEESKSNEIQIIKNSDIVAFENINKFPVRIKCALLPWITLKTILQNRKN
ncbi:MAG: SUF system NifU family Fe-S cluster assembly protein [bacterium]|nr:SUF system NifU family Fe-S cluster assembly protein [bacterium]